MADEVNGKGGKGILKILIEAKPKEIAELVLALQNKSDDTRYYADGNMIYKTARGWFDNDNSQTATTEEEETK